MFKSSFKKSFFITLTLILLLGGFGNSWKESVSAEEIGEKIELYFFYSQTCPHCQKEKVFLENLEEEYCQLEVKKLLFSENIELVQEFYEKYDVPAELYGAIPISFAGDRYFLAYNSDETTGKEIEDYIIALREGNESCPTTTTAATTVSFFGLKIDTSRFSLLPLTIVLGTLDGFNACAMVALAFLLTMLVATGVRKRVVLIGGTFILVSGIVYFLFISAWLNLFLVSKHLGLITLIVGIVIIFFSLILLKDYCYGIICKLCEIRPGKESIFVKWQRGLLEKMKKITFSDFSLLLMLLGVAAVAAGVNSVELVCSFGFPLAFTKILSNLELSTFSYYIYLLIYIFFYMLDDFLIFLVAVLTLRITGVSQKYLRAIKLISGIVLLLLGLTLLIKPELLSFI